MKRIFLIGSTGFVGRAITESLLREGYSLRLCMRNPPAASDNLRVEYVAGDFSADHDSAVWQERLEGCDAVINAVGIIRETGIATFENLHGKGPLALFQAAASRRIRKVIQVSALGADYGAETAYHLTKRNADESLRSLIPSSIVLRPSLIIGNGGKSSKLFAFLALLPVLFLPGGGEFRLQPLRVSDLADGIASLLKKWPRGGAVVDVTGPEEVTLAEMLEAFRRNAGFFKAVRLSIPMIGMQILARANVGMLNRDTLSMLERENTGDPQPFERLTGLKMQSAMDLQQSGISLFQAGVLALRPLLRLSIAALWIWTAIVTLFMYPIETSLHWLKQAGIPDALLPFSFYGSCAFDLMLGMLLFTRFRRLSYGIQILAVGFYTLIILFQIPEFWLHPFGPISKNIPLMILTMIGWLFDGRESYR